MIEEFTPISNSAPDTPINWLKFKARLLADFQVRTVYKHLLTFLPLAKGKLLDIGCGQSPYRHLFVPLGVKYVGIDIEEAKNFGYERADIIHFDGLTIPFESESFDTIICTEVLEHTPNPELLIAEMYRVLKKEGAAFISVPWSARTHYMPHDYHRFTPTRLAVLFEKFQNVSVVARGNDINTISAKVIVVYLRQLAALRNIKHSLWLIRLLGSLVGLPFVALSLFVGHFSLIFRIGSESDPLGYSIFLVK